MTVRPLPTGGTAKAWFRLAPWQTALLVVFLSVGIGFVLTRQGIVTRDDTTRYSHSQWLLTKYGIGTFNGAWTQYTKSYSSVIVEFSLGLLTEHVFSFLRDPYWIRHAVVLSLFPLSLFAAYVLLKKARLKASTAFLASAMLFGIIRLGGHAYVNIKDFPYAVGYLLVTLLLWVLLLGLHTRVEKNRPSCLVAVLLGVVSVVPFLLHTPDLSHFAVVLGLLAVYGAFVPARWPLWKRLSLPLIAFLSGVLTLFLLYPPFREAGFLDAWMLKFGKSIDFGWMGTVRYLGRDDSPYRLPWWFAFAWLPVMANPVAFLLLAVGFPLGFFQSRVVGESLPLRIGSMKFDLSLRRWLWLFVMITWVAIAVLRPSQYEEERHMLFVFPLVFLLGVLAFDALRDRAKYILASVLIVASASSYLYWGRYSYVYKSPIIGTWKTQDFSGDYWGACVALGVNALKGRVDPAVPVVVDELAHIAEVENDRLTAGFFSRDPKFGEYKFVYGVPKERPYATIACNKMDRNRNVLDDIANGKAELLWKTLMPPGDTACVMAIYR